MFIIVVLANWLLLLLGWLAGWLDDCCVCQAGTAKSKHAIHGVGGRVERNPWSHFNNNSPQTMDGRDSMLTVGTCQRN